MKKKLLSAMLAAAIAAGSFFVPKTGVTAYAAVSTAVTSELSAPTASLPSGKYNTFGEINIKLSHDPNAMIFYSLNGTGYRLYSEPITLTHDSVIKTYAYVGQRYTPTATYTYNMIAPVTISHNSGSYNGMQRVGLTCNVEGAKLYYTLDGSTPNERSTLYLSNIGILISESCELKVVAVKTGWSRYVNARTYTINGVTEPLGVNPDGGLIESPEEEKSLSKLDDYKSKWGYNRLTSTQKAVYERLFASVKKHGENIEISDIKAKEKDIDAAYWAFDYDNPQFFALGNGFSYRYYPSTGVVATLSPKYGRTAEQERSIHLIFDVVSRFVIRSAEDYSSDYEKLKYVHDWIVNKTNYSLTAPVYKSEADGVIVYGTALCEGYSKAFMYFAQSLGYDCICVVGQANGGAHMWNMVKIGGSWYHVDVTFDDPVMSDGSHTLTHDFFLLSTTEISRTHKIDSPVTVPSALHSYTAR